MSDVFDDLINRQPPPNDPARVALVIASDERYAYFGTSAFAIRLLRLDQKIVSGVPMSLRHVANVLGTDAMLFQEFCDRFSKYDDRTADAVRGRAGGRGAGVLKGASHFVKRLAHFDQLQLPTKVGRNRLKSNPLCLAGHRRSKTFGAFDLAAQVVGVGHGCRSMVRITMQLFG
jgi:hypothetical protein